MSTFAAEVLRVSEVWDHPDADRLELCKVGDIDYQMVVPKGRFEVGDRVAYFPLDSVLPLDVLQAIGLEGKLGGKARNRVKTVKLRGQVSQGLVAGLLEVVASMKEGTDLTTALGVTKWSPEEVQGGTNMVMFPLPPQVCVYDIENAERYTKAWEELVNGVDSLFVMEKLEGTNFCAVLDHNNKFSVCSRRHTVEEDDNVYWRMAKKYNLFDKMLSLKSMGGVHCISVHGEIIGPKVQGNYYELAENELRLFDIKLNEEWLCRDDFLSLCGDQFRTVPHAPVLLSTDLCADGKSALHTNKLREGIVVRPCVERYSPRIGRLILKRRSKAYLLKEQD